MIFNNLRDILHSQIWSALLLFVQALPLYLLVIKNSLSSVYVSKKILVFFLLTLVLIILKTHDARDLIHWIRWFMLPFVWYFVGYKAIKFPDRLTPQLHALFYISVFLAFIKYFVLGWHGEKPLGLIGHSGSTYVILVSFMIFQTSVWNNQKLGQLKRLVVTLLYLFSLAILVLASAKRIVLFVIPFLALLPLFRFRFGMRHIFLVSAILLIALVGLLNSSTLNVEGDTLGNYDFSKMVDYVKSYEAINREDEVGNTIGRSGTSSRILKILLENPLKMLVGENTFIFGVSESSKNIGISYGLSGFFMLLLNFGLPLSLLYFSFLVSEIKSWGRSQRSVHLRSSGWLVIILLLFYSPEFVNPTLASLFYLLLGYFHENKNRNYRAGP